MILGHGGNVHALAQSLGCRPEEIVDVSSNINPLGPPPGLMDHLRENLAVVCRLPEVDSHTVTAAMAAGLGIDARCILAGAGTTQFIHIMFAVLQSRRVLIVGPTYSDYADACAGHGLEPSYFLARAGNGFQPDMALLEQRIKSADTVVVCNPNNPTGALMPGEVLLDLCRRHPDVRFVIDESYLPFVPEAQARSMGAHGLDNVVVLHSLSKIFRLPGLRMGFVIAGSQIIDAFRRVMLPWSLNSLAQAAVEYLVAHQESVAEFIRRTRVFVAEEQRRFSLRLQENASLTVYPSRANFFLIALSRPLTAGRVCAWLAHKRVLVRDCSNFFGLNEHFIRIALHQPDVNSKVAEMLIALQPGSCNHDPFWS